MAFFSDFQHEGEKAPIASYSWFYLSQQDPEKTEVQPYWHYIFYLFSFSCYFFIFNLLFETGICISNETKLVIKWS